MFYTLRYNRSSVSTRDSCVMGCIFHSGYMFAKRWSKCSRIKKKVHYLCCRWHRCSSRRNSCGSECGIRLQLGRCWLEAVKVMIRHLCRKGTPLVPLPVLVCICVTFSLKLSSSRIYADTRIPFIALIRCCRWVTLLTPNGCG